MYLGRNLKHFKTCQHFMDPEMVNKKLVSVDTLKQFRLQSDRMCQQILTFMLYFEQIF